MESGSKQDYVNLIGIDPGSESLGVAILSIDIETLSLIKVSSKTFRGSKMKGYDWLEDAYSERMQKIYKHKDNLKDIYLEYSPIAVVCESPFINMKRPGAFGALTEIVFAIKQSVIEYSPWVPFYSIEPSNVKKGIGAPGNADKLVVKKHLLANVEIISKLDCNIEDLDEHSVDAICVAYTQFKKYKGQNL